MHRDVVIDQIMEAEIFFFLTNGGRDHGGGDIFKTSHFRHNRQRADFASFGGGVEDRDRTPT